MIATFLDYFLTGLTIIFFLASLALFLYLVYKLKQYEKSVSEDEEPGDGSPRQDI